MNLYKVLAAALSHAAVSKLSSKCTLGAEFTKKPDCLNLSGSCMVCVTSIKVDRHSSFAMARLYSKLPFSDDVLCMSVPC